MPEQLLIIGYGNPVRGDDGLGWRATECLSETLGGEDVEVLACHQLSVELAEPVSRARAVLFIDARLGGHPGRFHFETLNPDPSESSAFSHHLTPASLLACAGALYGRSPEATLASVEGGSFDFAETLSPPVRAVLPELLDQVREWTHRRLEMPKGD